MTAEFRLTGSLTVDPTWSDNLNASRVIDSARASLRFTLDDGDGPGEADGYYKNLVTIADGDTLTIDVEDLPRNVFGGTASLDLAAVKVILIRNLSPDVAVSEKSPLTASTGRPTASAAICTSAMCDP